MTDTVGRNSKSQPAELKNTETKKDESVALNFQTGTYSRSTGDTNSESQDKESE